MVTWFVSDYFVYMGWTGYLYIFGVQYNQLFDQ
jgi:hypothetical protein